MSGRRWRLLFCLAAVVILATAALYQSALIGWWRGEAKYKGRYTNSWRAELRSYSVIPLADVGTFDSFFFFRKPSGWETWLAKLAPWQVETNDYCPPLQEGDLEAMPVVVELLRAPEANVRVIAAWGIKEIGAPARAAIPALLALENDKDPDVRLACQLAIGSINHKIAK